MNVFEIYDGIINLNLVIIKLKELVVIIGIFNFIFEYWVGWLVVLIYKWFLK